MIGLHRILPFYEFVALLRHNTVPIAPEQIHIFNYSIAKMSSWDDGMFIIHQLNYKTFITINSHGKLESILRKKEKNPL